MLIKFLKVLIVAKSINQFTYSYYVIGGLSSTLEIQAPKYVLLQDTFTVTCRANKPVGIIVKHCIRDSTRKEIDGSGSSFRIVAHTEKACEVWCFTKDNRKKQIIPVIRKRI